MAIGIIFVCNIFENVIGVPFVRSCAGRPGAILGATWGGKGRANLV